MALSSAQLSVDNAAALVGPAAQHPISSANAFHCHFLQALSIGDDRSPISTPQAYGASDARMAVTREDPPLVMHLLLLLIIQRLTVRGRDSKCRSSPGRGRDGGHCSAHEIAALLQLCWATTVASFATHAAMGYHLTYGPDGWMTYRRCSGNASHVCWFFCIPARPPCFAGAAVGTVCNQWGSEQRAEQHDAGPIH